MTTLQQKLNDALINNKSNVAAIIPLTGYLSFFSQSGNAPILELEALFQKASGHPYRFSYDARKNMAPSFSFSLLVDYRNPKKIDLVLEDETGNMIIDTEKRDIYGAVCLKVQHSLSHPEQVTTCFAAIEPGRGGIWLATPNDFLTHVGMAYIRWTEAALPPEAPRFSATPFPSVPTLIEEDNYDEQDF